VVTIEVPASEAPDTLGPEQYGQPVKVAEAPVPALAWIHTRNGHQLVEGEAIAWTPRAVRVRYADDQGRVGTAWLWAKAVSRR